ncbi:MAG TPA: TonB-dependent receptor [Candidatus Acidoferrales bacterium]|nr:TonB-dependent receptor [Candidatus Acidoferrales bacterium]
MSVRQSFLLILIVCLCVVAFPAASWAQAGNSSTVSGTVLDPSGAIVAKATVTIHDPVSGYERSTTTDSSGNFSFANVPFNTYHTTVIAAGFAPYTQDVDVRSVVPVEVNVKLQVAGSSTTVTVTSEPNDLLEDTPTEHTDIDRNLFNKLPLESQSSSLSSLVTLASPGVVADSNGLFHGLGDHAENSFSVDGQPITDQQSKVFSNQIPIDSVQSLEVIEGAPPAEYGGKTSVIAKVTTRSGMGVTTPHGDVTTSYGTFGSSTLGVDVSYGGQNWGDFISLDGLNTGRFLDPPEFQVLHDKGNEENYFDRFDFKPSTEDSIQLNLEFTRSWSQNPNTWDQQLQECTFLSALCSGAPGTYAPGSVVLNPITHNPLGPTDQRSQIRTFNIAPTWTRLMGSDAVFTLGTWIRRDQYNYYPSNDPFSDLGPLQDETVSQLRFLTNAGARVGWSYVKGVQNLDVGASFEHTFLTEDDDFGIVNPGLLAGCTSAACNTLRPFDLTEGGQLFGYHGHTDVKESALYLQDDLTKGPWVFNLGLRADFYNGLQASSNQAEPRLGVAYHLNKTNSVLQVSYARTMESPFNENLVLSGTGCNVPVVAAIMQIAQGFACGEVSSTGAIVPLNPLTPGFRNEFHAGLQQAFGKYFVLSGEYIWKYTHNGYDFNVFGTSPITLPIEWHNSKIPGYAIRASVPSFHGVTAFVVMSHVNARFFPPTVSGIAPPAPPGVFRIDHDENFGETTHLQYQLPWKNSPWMGFNWRYDSGLVSGAVPCLANTATCSLSTGGSSGIVPPPGDIALVNNINGLALTADQEFEAGLTCNGVGATPTTPLPSVCPATELNSSLVKIPAPGKENDDHNPQRIQPRSLFDVAVGDDNLFHVHSDRYKWSAQFTVINLANNYALYNFYSTFSGTHYVTPRTFTGEIGFHF